MIDLVGTRLRTQHLIGDGLPDAGAVVRRFAALQAQDYPAAVWAIAQRTPGLSRAEIDADYAAGHLIRTHVLRPTWHLVAPEDLRWLLELTAPRVHQANGTMYRREGLDAGSLARGEQLVADAIAEQGPLTRVQLSAALEAAGFPGATGLRGTYVLMAAELDRLICSAGLIGKQHGYALFDERVPPSALLGREAALSELAVRYYRGHGPATPADLAWWGGLTLGNARAATAAAADRLVHHEVGGVEYWVTIENDAAPASAVSSSGAAAPRVHLLPNYDEYTVAYKDRSMLAADFTSEPPADLFFRHVVLVDGLVSGGWRNVSSAKEHVLEIRLAIDGTPEIEAGIVDAAGRYGLANAVSVRVEYPS